MTLSQQFKALRKRQGLTQVQAAKAMGISIRALQAVEAGGARRLHINALSGASAYPKEYYEGLEPKTDNCPYGNDELQKRCWWFAGRFDRGGE